MRTAFTLFIACLFFVGVGIGFVARGFIAGYRSGSAACDHMVKKYLV